MPTRWRLPLLSLFAALLALPPGCAGSDDTADNQGQTSSLGGKGGSAGKGGAGGSSQAGSPQAGSSGSPQAGQGGSGGQSAGSAGSAGQGAGGKGGKGGSAQAGGSAGQAPAGGAGAAGSAGSGASGASGDAGAPAQGGSAGSGGKEPGPCTTRITYGSAWIHGPDHTTQFDIAQGSVTWDGACTHDGDNSYAVLSNGWKPYFSGHGCTIALDYTSCPGAPSACDTRVAYGPAWLPPENHPASYDDVGGRLLWDGRCQNTGGSSFASLSNGWAPHFQGNGACDLSFRFQQCGGLYQNPVIATDCPDPGVLRDGSTYYMVCTGGDGGGAYVIRSSTDLVSWTNAGHIFPWDKAPSWAKGDFWAPEIHRVGDHYVAYFSARHQDGTLSVGAASGPTPLGPFTDLGQPLVHEPPMGMIDVSEFTDAQGTPFLIWKADGNAVGKPTPIYGQQLAPDGLSLVGQRATLISNNLGWEGPLVEGPWVVRKDGSFFLFYSANAYYNGTYAVGVARSSNPLGPYEKAGDPILRSEGPWVGPGHCSVVDTPAGDFYMVYHAWQAGHVNGPGDGRLTLVDAVTWGNGWPAVPAGPSARSLPLP